MLRGNTPEHAGVEGGAGVLLWAPRTAGYEAVALI